MPMDALVTRGAAAHWLSRSQPANQGPPAAGSPERACSGERVRTERRERHESVPTKPQRGRLKATGGFLPMSVHLERWLRKWCASSRACARCVLESDSALRIAHGESVGRSMLLAGSLSGSCQKMSILLVLSEKQTRAGVVGSYWVAVHPKHGSCDRCRDHHGPTLRPRYAGVAAGQGHHAQRAQ